MNEQQKILETIESAGNILLVCHYDPDVDAAASICALAEFLERKNKRYTVYCRDQFPSRFYFLPHSEKLNYQTGEYGESSAFRLDFASFDLIIVCDCGSLGRSGLSEEIKNRRPRQKVIEFDHHPKIDSYADFSVKDHSASATVEIVYDFFRANRIRINKAMAVCILAGIITDTGNFLNPSTTEKAVRVASEMTSVGASLPFILKKIWRNKSVKGLKTWGKVMSSLKINKELNIASAVLTFKDFSEAEISHEEVEGIANFLGSIEGVKAVLFLREEQEGLVKGSLRTVRPEVDVSRLARALGGGGHTKAAGFSIEGRLVTKPDGSYRVVGNEI